MRRLDADLSSPRREMLCDDLDEVVARARLWVASPEEPSESTRAEQMERCLRAALGTALTERQRDVVEMHFFLGLSQGEIARALGISQQVVHKCLYGVTRRGRSIGGALRRLREVLDPQLGAAV